MKIGNLDLGNKLLLAPMAEVSDAPFRKISMEFGAGLVFTQMVSAEGVAKNNFNTLKLLSFGRDEKPIGVQLLGNDPQWIQAAAREIAKIGSDLIDLNCGCPISKVTKNHMGSSILDDPDLLRKLIKAMAAGAGKVPVTVKIRLGKDRRKINALENAKIAEDSGAAAVILHARFRNDRYSDEAQWEKIAAVKDSLSIPVIGNGSVFEPQDAIELLSQTKCDSVMLARGALGNPYFFSRFNSLIETGIDPGEPSIEEISQTLTKHINLIEKEYGEIIGLNYAKKHSLWYFRKTIGISYLLDTIFQIRSISELIDHIEKFTERSKQQEFPEENFESLQKKFNNKVLFWLDDNND